MGYFLIKAGVYFLVSIGLVFLNLWAAKQLQGTLKLFVKNDNSAKAYTL